MPFTIDIRKDRFFLQGREEGRAEGREEGREEIRIQNALRMLRSGSLSLESIAEFSGLSLEKVKSLQQEIEA